MKKIIFSIFLLNIIFLNSSFAQVAEDPFIPMEAKFLTESAKAGDIVSLKLKINLSDLIIPDSIPIEGFDELIIMGIKKEPDGIIINILADKVGVLQIPELKIKLESSSGESYLYKSEPVTLGVGLPLSEEELKDAYIKPIKDIFPISSSWKILPYLIIILIAIMCFIGWYFYKNRKQKQIETAKSVPPEEIAFNKLRLLHNNISLQNLEQKEFYFILTLIVREYMEKIRDFPAAELTTDELVQYIKLDKDREILKLLKLADLIKFADRTTTTSEREDHYKASWKYVKETTDERLTKAQEALQT